MKCQYKVRWFSSKGAFLVLLWTFLIFVVCTLYLSYSGLLPKNYRSSSLRWLAMIPGLAGFVAAPLSGWLADAKFGNYKVFSVGAVLLFIATVMNCLFLIMRELALGESSVLSWVQLHLGSCFFVVGGCVCFITGLPLGLDQMPDASSSKIASYIAWFVWSLFAGCFLSGTFEVLRKSCFDGAMKSSYSKLCTGLIMSYP